MFVALTERYGWRKWCFSKVLAKKKAKSKPKPKYRKGKERAAVDVEEKELEEEKKNEEEEMYVLGCICNEVLFASKHLIHFRKTKGNE